jgi:decaprenylphospho-beta-D-ribofuranose 2-oxidase
VPLDAERALRDAVARYDAARAPAALTVLKRFGSGAPGLSFPMPGWTLAVDLPAGWPGLRALLEDLDDLVAEAGGRVYLAKDARLRAERLAAMYPELGRWRELRARLDPAGRMRSDLARRLELA